MRALLPEDLPLTGGHFNPHGPGLGILDHSQAVFPFIEDDMDFIHEGPDPGILPDLFIMPANRGYLRGGAAQGIAGIEAIVIRRFQLILSKTGKASQDMDLGFNLLYLLRSQIFFFKDPDEVIDCPGQDPAHRIDLVEQPQLGYNFLFDPP